MGLLKSFLQKRKERREKSNYDCNQLLLQVEHSINDINSLFIDHYNYIDPQKNELMQNKWGFLLNKTSMPSIKSLKKADSYIKLLSQIHNHKTCFLNIANNIRTHNNIVAQAKVNHAYSLIGNVEGRKLDFQQMQSVVKESYNHLVIAGAGTGKTTTIIGRIKYILKSGLCSPKEILVLSFTNTSASEMKDRICKETGEDIEASTFHKLGLNIIKKVNGITPKITRISLRNLIKESLQKLMQNRQYLQLLATYLLYNKVTPKSEFEFKSQNEYDEYLTLNPPTTLNNEVVKSYGEMDIANYLTYNRINYIYERAYEKDSRTGDFAQYCPDFYLPDYGIYIEYFGIDKDGNVPDYFTGKNGKTAKQIYNESIDWKRKIHKENSTILVECFAYEKLQDDLLINLESNLKIFDVKLSPKPADLLWKEISSREESILDGLIELFETTINLIKSNNYTFDILRAINKQKCENIVANAQLISLIEPLYNEYNQKLKENEEIDFNDMINLATKQVTEGKFNHSYKYVIVDEYQDISKARYMLLKAMRNVSDYNLFCVGDDWQSIYRFAGSDIGFILRFQIYWGPAEISKIETTYRFSQKLIDVSSSFVMKNPMQIQKMINGHSVSIRQVIGEINGYTEKYAVVFLVTKLLDFPKNSTVYFIGRYSFDINIIQENNEFTCKYNNITGMVEVYFSKRKDLKICFLTAHKSKGLQADYVIILNNKKSRMGFPSKIQDSPILKLLIDDCDNYPYAEERRLFYVALTRAKIKAILLTVKDSESEFVQEIKYNFADEIKSEAFECPLCGGKLLKKSGQYGDFLGCYNYKTSDCKYTRNFKSN